jgi:hypothetical protein
VWGLWAGIDAGKAHHHCVAIDEDGRRLFSRRVANNEAEACLRVYSRDKIGVTHHRICVSACAKDRK